MIEAQFKDSFFVNCSNCDDQATCTRTEKGFKCLCPEGFTGVDGTKCNDIDECQDSIHNCSTTQKCVNTVGSFSCFKGN